MTAENRGMGRHPPEGHKFVKGQSGNPGGRPKFAELSKALRTRLIGATPKVKAKVKGVSAADTIAGKLVAAACLGKPWAVREVWDRAEGKPRQEFTGAEGEDLFPSDAGAATVASMLEKLAAIKEAEKKK